MMGTGWFFPPLLVHKMRTRTCISSIVYPVWPAINRHGIIIRLRFNSHRSLPWIMSASPPVSGCILPAVLLCKNRGKVETLFENFLNHSVQHRLQRVLSSYGQLSFRLLLHIYMAKIIVFGNTCMRFRDIFSLIHPRPLLEAHNDHKGLRRGA